MSDTSPAYAIVVCSRCRAGSAAPTLAARLAPHAEADGFRIDAVACLAGCERPLAVAFAAPAKATFLFGDIDPERDAEALAAFGRQYRDLPDGWCNEGQRPAGLRGKTLARIPPFEGLSR